LLLFTKMTKENESVADIFDWYCFNRIMKFREDHLTEFGEDLFKYECDSENGTPDRILKLSFTMPEKKISESYLECLEEMLANVFAGSATQITARSVKENCNKEVYEKLFPGEDDVVINIYFRKEVDRLAIELYNQLQTNKKVPEQSI